MTKSNTKKAVKKTIKPTIRLSEIDKVKKQMKNLISKMDKMIDANKVNKMIDAKLMEYSNRKISFTIDPKRAMESLKRFSPTPKEVAAMENDQRRKESISIPLTDLMITKLPTLPKH